MYKCFQKPRFTRQADSLLRVNVSPNGIHIKNSALICLFSSLCTKTALTCLSLFDNLY